MPLKRILSILILLPVIAGLLAVLPAQAQMSLPSGEAGSESEQKAASQENIEGLIETLENQAGREQLIADLRALLQAQEHSAEDTEAAEELVSAVQIDEVARSLEQQYTDFLESQGLDASLVGHLIATGGLVIILLLLLFILRKILRSVHHRLNALALRHNLSPRRIGLYISGIKTCLYIILFMALLAALATLWGFDLDRWISNETQLSFLQAVISVAIVLAVGAFIIELSNAIVEHFFRSRLAHHEARMNTLLPIARTVLLLTLFTLFGLTLLAQLGLDVMPLLAGAGVVGFAVGFGAQTLIKDVLTGFIVIVEDLIQVGDVAGVGGKTGLVEKITIRKVQLRDLAGTVFTVPFSEISVVENLTKDFSYYLMDIGIAYREDTDRVIGLLQEIDAGMREDEEFKDRITEPLEVLGVDRFADSAVIIKARIKTPPLQQWGVGREFNRRMKQVFDANNVEIPFPHRTLYFGQDTDGSAPPAPIKLLQQESANDTGTEGSA